MARHPPFQRGGSGLRARPGPPSRCGRAGADRSAGRFESPGGKERLARDAPSPAQQKPRSVAPSIPRGSRRQSQGGTARRKTRSWARRQQALKDESPGEDRRGDPPDSCRARSLEVDARRRSGHPNPKGIIRRRRQRQEGRTPETGSDRHEEQASGGRVNARVDRHDDPDPA